MADFRIPPLFIALAALLPLSAAEKPQLATEVCKNTTDFEFCRAAIYSDPRAATADRYDLIDIAFRKAYLNATDTRDYIAANLESGGGKSGGLEICLVSYKEADQKLALMLNDLNSESYFGLDEMSLEVERSVRRCRRSLQGRSILSERNENMLKLAKICYVVSKLFEYHQIFH